MEINETIKIPFGITDFKIQKFQGIKELSINNIPINTQWIFLTGENGFGKTSVLRALLLGLIGRREFSDIDFEKEIGENARIELTFTDIENITQEQIIKNIFGSNNFKPHDANVAAYGAKRTDFEPEAKDIPISYNLFEKSSFVLNTEYKLKTLDGNKDLIQFKNKIIESFLFLIPKLARLEFVAEEGVSNEIYYYEKDDNGNELPPVKLNQLAMGFRNIICLIGDIIQRLSKNKTFVNKKNPFIFETPIDPFAELKELHGIVIIDEFDNHLHPKWQRELVNNLTKFFPKVQFIVSTHSPIPLLGAPPDRTVILNVNRTKEEGITVKRLFRIEKELSNLLPNVLLTSPVFGLDNIKSIYNQNIEDVIVDDNYNDREKYDLLDKSIDEFFKTNNWENNELFREENDTNK